MQLESLVHSLAGGVEAAGVAVLILGAALVSVRFCLECFRSPMRTPYQRLRMNLGRVILLGLELLVIADIIGTVAVTPTFRNLGVLGLLVVIRTFLSFALEIELHGRLPWRSAREKALPGE